MDVATALFKISILHSINHNMAYPPATATTLYDLVKHFLAFPPISSILSF